MSFRAHRAYILCGHEPVPIEDDTEHGDWMRGHADQCRVARTSLQDEASGQRCVVYTSFLGRNHNFSLDGPPILFETMIRDLRTEGWWHEQWRYSTWEQAEEGHSAAVEYARRQMAEHRDEGGTPQPCDGDGR